jgi:acetyl-CoA carboxylase biotin carboxylase subunit
MADAGLPVPGGTARPLVGYDEARDRAEQVGYPVILKASAGGGGRGMRRVDEPGQLPAAWSAASAEAQSAFGDGRLFLERYVRRARHVEVQVLADGPGRAIHLGDRDCTLQRRYQKLVEEAPAADLPPELQRDIRAAAVALIGALDYRGAATCEFLVDVERATWSFLEVNARLQVEHPVTELVTGIDVVREQLRIAAGDGLSIAQDDVQLRGHAIEARINAERPRDGFAPSPGVLTRWAAPVGSYVRVDTACFPGWTVAPWYDSLLAKLIAWGEDRPTALARLRHALDHIVVEGVETTAPFVAELLDHPDVQSGDVHTRWIEDELLAPAAS